MHIPSWLILISSCSLWASCPSSACSDQPTISSLEPRAVLGFPYLTSDISAIGFSPDGRYVATGGDGKVLRIWDTETRKDIFDLKRFRGEFTGSITALDYSPDGKSLVLGVHTSNACPILNISKLEIEYSLSAQKGRIYAVAWSPDGSVVATGGEDRHIYLWDVKTRKLIKSLKGQTGDVSALKYTSDGDKLISGGWDGSILVWDVKTGKILRRLEGHESGVDELTLRGDDKILASADGLETTILWDLQHGKELHPLKGICPAFTRDGRYIITAALQQLRVWEVSTGTLRAEYKGEDGLIGPQVAEMSPDGKTYAVGCNEGLLSLWDVKKLMGFQ